MEVHGDFKQLTDNNAFVSTGTHKVILNGIGMQNFISNKGYTKINP